MSTGDPSWEWTNVPLPPPDRGVADPYIDHRGRLREPKEATPIQPNPDHRPDHDSLVVRFDQLEDMLVRLKHDVPSVLDARRADFALDLVKLIRGQVIK